MICLMCNKPFYKQVYTNIGLPCELCKPCCDNDIEKNKK